MTRTQIKATMLLLCIFALGACQKDEKTNKRTRVNAQIRLSKNMPEEKGQPTEKGAETEDEQVMPNELCDTNGPLYCSAIRVASDETGTIVDTGVSQTANVQPPLRLSVKNPNVTKTSDENSVSFTIKNKIQNENVKLVVVLASLAEDKKLKELTANLKFNNVRIEKIELSKVKDNIKAAEELKIAADEKVLIVTKDGDVKSKAHASAIVLVKAKPAQFTEQSVKTTTEPYELEGKVLQLIGTRVYLQFVLPVELAKLSVVELIVNEKAVAKRGEDFDLVENKNSTNLRILKRSILKNIKDTLTIKYSTIPTKAEEPVEAADLDETEN
jgi:hypothetical protein